MQGSLNNQYPFNDDLKLNLQYVLGITLGVFLFLLFFQPLDPPGSDFNEKLLILSGFGLITLLLLSLCRIVFPVLVPRVFLPEKWTVKKEILLHLVFLALHPVAYVFFARYVGIIEITFLLVVNIVLISLAIVAAFIIMNEYKFLKTRLHSLVGQYRGDKIPDDEGSADTGIEFESETQSEHLVLFPEQIILIKSASNYIEIIYKQHEKVSRQLIRGTMKKAEKQVSKYPYLIRCHRSCIVNSKSIRNVRKADEGLKLELYDYPREVSVSRQYVLIVKGALNQPD